MENVTEEELETLRVKASRYDEIETKISDAYTNDKHDNWDLADIGEYIATYFGWL